MIRFFNQQIFVQVYFYIVLVTAIMMGVIGYLMLQEQERSILEVMRTQAQSIAKSIELVSADAMVTDDQSFMVEHNLNVLEHTPTIRFILISKNRGSVLLTQQQSWKLMEELPESVQPLENKKEQQLIWNNPYIQESEAIYYYVYPLDFDGIAWGWIHLGFSLDNLNHAFNTMYKNMGLIFAIAFVLISIVIFFLTRRMINPITALSQATKAMAQGNLKIRLHTNRSDEIGTLTRNFNFMAEALMRSQNDLLQSNVLLEQKVEERTRELEEINRTLDERVRREISRRREQEQILIQQSRFAAMGEMIGNIAHQWRQPLNALSLLLQNIANAYETDRLDAAFIKRVNEKGLLLTSTMSTTIDDFRNFFKPNRTKEPFNIAEQINTTQQMLQASFNDHFITVTLDIEDDLVVEGFANEFSQVLLNILNNAKDALIEHTESERSIVLRAYRKATDIVIDISDNGGGIDPKLINKIFDPYFTTKEEGKGTGIGLYMSKVIIENNMDGHLKVSTTKEGAVFSIVLPAFEEE